MSGDYLAIVTLAFGEIFRIAMINLDGNDGPDLTNGSNGIPGIPDLNFFGFDFGAAHELLGIPLGRFANYYFLLLLVIGVIILVFMPPQRQPDRAWLGGDPRGRAGRRGDGRQRLRR